MNKSEVIYLDDDKKVVEKEQATRVIIRELDENGALVKEVFGKINK